MYLIQEYRAQFQNVNKKKILVLNPSSRVGFEGPFKTASSELKKIQNWKVSLIHLKYLWVSFTRLSKAMSQFFHIKDQTSEFIE